MKHTYYNHYIVMFCIMILSGFLTTMNVWVDKWDDIRYSLNDLYMVLLMTGWMFLFMGLYYGELLVTLVGFIFVVINLFCIRTQYMVTTEQFMLGMIPHHSMAVHMSKKLLKNQSPLLHDFASNIIVAQEDEITYMKELLTKLKESV